MVMSPFWQVVRDGRWLAVVLPSVVELVVVAGTPDAFNPFLLGRHFLRLAIPCLVAAPPPTRLCCWMLVADPFASRFVYNRKTKSKTRIKHVRYRHMNVSGWTKTRECRMINIFPYDDDVYLYAYWDIFARTIAEIKEGDTSWYFLASLFSPGHTDPLTNNSASFSLFIKIKLRPSVRLSSYWPARDLRSSREPIMNLLSWLVAHFSMNGQAPSDNKRLVYPVLPLPRSNVNLL